MPLGEGVAQHAFTRRDLTMRVLVARMAALPAGTPQDAAARSMPRAMSKLLPLIQPL